MLIPSRFSIRTIRDSREMNIPLFLLTELLQNPNDEDKKELIDAPLSAR